jgi:hypothetical protein
VAITTVLFRIFRLHIVTKNNTPLSLFKFRFRRQALYFTPQPSRKSRPDCFNLPPESLQLTR